jgi:phospholipid/cholesterol/gamma-HCH transport system substrate-binding protein
MDNKVNYAIIGIFVIILNIALVASILWLSVGIEKKSYQTYQVYVQESVSGLNHKAPVKYRGLEVGYVRDVALEPSRPHEVRVLLDIEVGVPLKQDTLVILSVQGLTGLAHIELTGGSLNASQPIREEGQPFPEIKTKPSLMVRLDTAVFDLLDNLNNVSTTVNSFLSYLSPEKTNNLLSNISDLARAMNIMLSEENHIAVTSILHSFEVVTKTLAAQTGNFDLGVSNLVQSTKNLNKMTEQVTSLLSQVEVSLASVEGSSNAFAKIAGAIKNTSDAFTKTAVSINDVVGSVNKTTGVISKTAANITIAVKDSRQDMDYFTRQALPEVTNSLRELRALLNNLRSFSQELKSKPNMFLFGKSKVPLGPGE